MPGPTKPKSTKAKPTQTKPADVIVPPVQTDTPKEILSTEQVNPATIEASPTKAGFFAWIRTHDHWWQFSMKILTLFIAVVGTWLLFNQNGLLKNQNTLIQHQMSLEEASRRSALVMLMSNIMDKVDDEIKDQKGELLRKGISKAAVDTMKFSLSQSLIGQIAALSHSFKPYRFMDGDSLIDYPLSPERGQLLITLSRLPMDTSTFNKVFESSTFAQADLRGANLYGMDLSDTHLLRANLSQALLMKIDLSDAVLAEADLSGAILIGADLSGADLKGADLSVVYLGGANLSGTDLREADLREVNLKGANLIGADLSGADLNGADLLIEQAQFLKTLFNCKNLEDSISNTLQQSHPKLFEKPRE